MPPRPPVRGPQPDLVPDSLPGNNDPDVRRPGVESPEPMPPDSLPGIPDEGGDPIPAPSPI
jgi:hypothetical protein